MKTHIDNTIEETKKEFDQIVQDLCDWNYGTVYKEYDREEEVEVLEEDTKEYAEKLWKLFEQRLTEVQAESKRYADERVIEYEKFRQMKDMKKVGIENPTIDDDCWALDLVNEFLNQNTESEEGEVK